MERVKIEILSLIKHDGQLFHAGEIRLVEPQLATYFCKNGWARDFAGDLPTNQPDLTPKTLEVQSGKHGHGATTPGVNENV